MRRVASKLVSVVLILVGLSSNAQAVAETKSDAKIVAQEARAFFTHLMAGDARGLLQRSAVPFQLEDRRFSSPDELLNEWLRNLRTKRTDLLKLYGINILTPAEMEKKYGKPPARISTFPWKGPQTLIAVGNLSGHAVVVIYKDIGRGDWKAIAYHD